MKKENYLVSVRLNEEEVALIDQYTFYRESRSAALRRLAIEHCQMLFVEDGKKTGQQLKNLKKNLLKEEQEKQTSQPLAKLQDDDPLPPQQEPATPPPSLVVKDVHVEKNYSERVTSLEEGLTFLRDHVSQKYASLVWSSLDKQKKANGNLEFYSYHDNEFSIKYYPATNALNILKNHPLDNSF